MKYRKVIFISLLLLLASLMCIFVFAQGVGYIQIKCEPGAMVFLDNNFMGNTSSELGIDGLILQDVPAGSHVIKIVKEGFEPQSVKIDLKVNEIYYYEVIEFIPQLDVIQTGDADTDTIKQRVGSLLIETIPIDCIIEIPKLNINKEHYGNKTKKTWEISKVPVGNYKLNFIALGKKIEYNLKIEEGVQKHLLVNILKNEVKEILPYDDEVKEIMTYYVTFSVEAGNGTIEARADGNLINSGDLVKEGVRVIFKVTPDIGQLVRSCEVDGTKRDTLIDGTYIVENLQSAIDFKIIFDVNPYKFGVKGPAGGWIFYDKGSYSNGWRYLEAAPASTEWNEKEWSNTLKWSEKQWNSYHNFGETETGIGTGQNNTTKIVAWLNSLSLTGKAAQLCNDLVYGGYNDWFLPSKDELNMIYTNLKVFGVGGFDGRGYYHSSSEFDAVNDVWKQNFRYGTQYYGNRTSKIHVRAVRAF